MVTIDEFRLMERLTIAMEKIAQYIEDEQKEKVAPKEKGV